MKMFAVFASLNLGFGIFSGTASAGWINAENCLVTDLRENVHFTGNTGNFNIQNVEDLYFALGGCSDGKSYYGSIYTILIPGQPVKMASGVLISSSAYQNWLNILGNARKSGARVSVSGEGNANLIQKPVMIRQ